MAGCIQVGSAKWTRMRLWPEANKMAALDEYAAQCKLKLPPPFFREAVLMMELPRRNATSLTGSRLAPITIIISRG